MIYVTIIGHLLLNKVVGRRLCHLSHYNPNWLLWKCYTWNHHFEVTYEIINKISTTLTAGLATTKIKIKTKRIQNQNTNKIKIKQLQNASALIYYKIKQLANSVVVFFNGLFSSVCTNSMSCSNRRAAVWAILGVDFQGRTMWTQP